MHTEERTTGRNRPPVVGASPALTLPVASSQGILVGRTWHPITLAAEGSAPARGDVACIAVLRGELTVNHRW